MVSVETCKKLQEEIIALIGDNLLEDDEVYLNLLSQSNNSKGVLELASELKEAGVSLYKKVQLDDALEKYGYAAMILARYHFEEECDRLEFLKLAISNLMNFVLCFSKKKEFVEVGRICSIVLEFDPYSVKAMYRRALAAIELGKRDWARLDLWMALDVDPNNKEVIKKLEELKGTPSEENSMNHSHGAVPFGLGTCLPPPKGKKSEVMDEGMSKMQGVSIANNSCQGLIGDQEKGVKKQENEGVLQGQAAPGECSTGSVVSEDNSTIIENGDIIGEIGVDANDQDEITKKDSTIIDGDDGKGEMIVNDEGKGDLVINNKHMEECQERSKDMSPMMLREEGREEIKEEIEEMVEDNSLSAELEDQLSCVCNSKVEENMILEEPKYRFHNRRKQGSNITLSRRDYLLLQERKTLRYFNAKSGSYMEVRICNNPSRVPSASKGDQKQHELHSMTSGEPPSTMEKQDKGDLMEYSDASSCVTSDDDQGSYEASSYDPRNDDGRSFHTKKHDAFHFFAFPTESTRRKSCNARMKSNKSPSLARNKRRKILHSDSISFAVNMYCGCRFTQIRKRKNAHPMPMDSYHQLRKRGRYTPPLVCSSESNYCTNVGNVTSVGYCYEPPYANVSCIRIDCREQVGASHGG